MFELPLYNKVRAFVLSHERQLSYAGLIFGFIFDAIFFKRIDLLFENIGIILHLVVGLFAMILLQMSESWYTKHWALERVRIFSPFIMQFAIGGLFGKFVIFYSKSGTIVKSWPFLIMLAVLFIGNESFRGKYERLNFRLAIFFVALYSYCIFSVPILLSEIGDNVFILSGVISLVVMLLIIYLLHRFVDNILWRHRMSIYGIILAIFVAFNAMYFLNIIPPIPLSLKQSGVYHSITRTSQGNYRVEYEDRGALFNVFKFVDTFRVVPGDSAYVYSAIFSPGKINTDIVHEWQLYDEVNKEWRIMQSVDLPIIGGRDNGFRTYSIRSGIEEGLWRVNVGTRRGQLIGRLNFKVVNVENPPLTTTQINY